MKLNTISFYTENCETITFEGKYIGDFKVENIQKSVERTAANEFALIRSANFAIELAASASNKEKFEHILKHNDIAQIFFTLDEKEYHFYVPWKDGKSDEENAYQYTYLSKCGNLYIVISDNALFKTYFSDYWKIDNQDYMDKKFKLYEVSYGE